MSQLNIDSIANQIGTGGPDFVGMPTVGGDPVVESGSNSDGSWTRWADGTASCLKGDVVFVQATSSYLEYEWTPPIALMSGKVGSGAMLNYVSGNMTDVSADQIGGLRAGSSYAAGTVHRSLVNTTGTLFTTTSQISGCTVWMTGRWK